MGSEQITRFWTLARADDPTSPLTCALFNTDHGLEICCRARDTVLHAQHVASRADAMNLSEAWKATYRGQGWIETPE